MAQESANIPFDMIAANLVGKWGAINKVAEKAGCSREWASRVLNRRWQKYLKVWKAASEVVAEMESEERKVTTAINRNIHHF